MDIKQLDIKAHFKIQNSLLQLNFLELERFRKWLNVLNQEINVLH